MNEGAKPLPVTISVDRNSVATDLVTLALLDHQLDGSQPYVRCMSFASSSAPAELLPVDATIQRCVTSDYSVTLVARLADVTIHIEASAAWANVQVAAPSHERADEVAGQIRDQVAEPPATTVPVRIWHHVQGSSARRVSRHIEAPRWSDISDNYPSDVRSLLDQVVSLERPTGKGKLLLWHGPPGTGKTTAVRALMREWEPWCQADYISDPERFFGEGAYITDVLTNATVLEVGPTLSQIRQSEPPWRLLVAEDTDDYLRSTARRDAGAALGRLLNMADGILGQGMNVLVLLTTNEEVSRLHPALIRPGRCLATVDFTRFDPTTASAWLRRPVKRAMTLAELLEARGDLSRLGATPDPLHATGQYL